MKKHILSVDDEPDIRELLQEVLTIKGYRVSTAAEAEQARKIVKEDPPQLIIMDFQIEEGDGFVLIEEFKRLAPATPILLLTGAVFDRQVVRDTIQKKVAGYLDKTASLSMIVSEIQRLLGDPQDTAAPA
jgi:DNA-binding NtrC family response regulator